MELAGFRMCSMCAEACANLIVVVAGIIVGVSVLLILSAVRDSPTVARFLEAIDPPDIALKQKGNAPSVIREGAAGQERQTGWAAGGSGEHAASHSGALSARTNAAGAAAWRGVVPDAGAGVGVGMGQEDALRVQTQRRGEWSHSPVRL
jgi:hypothetical protein